jgi:hypothetical protein
MKKSTVKSHGRGVKGKPKTKVKSHVRTTKRGFPRTPQHIIDKYNKNPNWMQDEDDAMQKHAHKELKGMGHPMGKKKFCDDHDYQTILNKEMGSHKGTRPPRKRATKK